MQMQKQRWNFESAMLRKCTRPGHEQYNLISFCLYPDCKDKRYCCQSCQTDGHQHDNSFMNIKDLDGFLNKNYPQEIFDELPQEQMQLKSIKEMCDRFSKQLQQFVQDITKIAKSFGFGWLEDYRDSPELTNDDLEYISAQLPKIMEKDVNNIEDFRIKLRQNKEQIQMPNLDLTQTKYKIEALFNSVVDPLKKFVDNYRKVQIVQEPVPKGYEFRLNTNLPCTLAKTIENVQHNQIEGFGHIFLEPSLSIFKRKYVSFGIHIMVGHDKFSSQFSVGLTSQSPEKFDYNSINETDLFYISSQGRLKQGESTTDLALKSLEIDHIYKIFISLDKKVFLIKDMGTQKEEQFQYNVVGDILIFFRLAGAKIEIINNI